MDKDHNGAVSRDELAQALQSSDMPLGEDDIDRVMQSLDKDGSGDISLAEFRTREEQALKQMHALYDDMKNTFQQAGNSTRC